MGFSSTRGRGPRTGTATTDPETGPLPPPDWPAQATDSIIKLVDNVRDKTAGPAITASRAVVYGLLIALLATPIFVLVLVGMMRAMEALLVQLGLEDPIWIVYLTFGTIFLLAGLFSWSKAKKPAA